MKPLNAKNAFGLKVMSIIRGYDHDKYWKRRSVVIDPDNKSNILLKLYYL
jgi:hypothetical protein